MIRYLADMEPDADTAFTAAEGLHWYCVDYHGGQWSDLYRIQCELRFKPSPLARGPEEDARGIYVALESGDINADALLEWIQATMSKDGGR